MPICKNCRRKVVQKEDESWIHEDDNLEKCKIEGKKAEPQRFCKSCFEPQYKKEICDCGDVYIVK
jgi:hypothetical protein